MDARSLSLIATCSEPELQQEVHQWLNQKKLYGSHHRVSVFGSVKNRETLMGQVRTTAQSGLLRRIFLFSHLGCTAYQDRNFANEELEREALVNDLNNTAAAI